MKRINFHLFFYSLCLAGVIPLSFGCNLSEAGKTGSQAPQSPNIIFMLADDLGYGDLSCYGSPSIETPHIDSLAKRGMKFTSFYAGSAVCSPSRACMLTGKFPLRFNIRRHFDDREMHLPAGVTTLPKLLKKAGYATVHIGKWHLGGLRIQDYEARQQGRPANPGPLQHGFDHYLCNIEDIPIRANLIQERKLYREGGKTLVRDDQKIPAIDKHWTEIKVDEACRWIEKYHAENKPFYINLWFDAPHTPYEPAPEPHLSKYEKLGATGDQLYFRSMVSHLDAQIGRLMKKLETLGIAENTLIVFTSDNGPAYQGSPGPFRGGKTDLHEGGIRVPMITVWENKIPANQISFQTAHMADWLPTFSKVAGIAEDLQDVDGTSLWSYLTTQQPVERDVLLWQMDLYKNYQNQGPKPKPYATAVALKGKWKLLSDSLQPTELFNLEQDHRELYNVLDKHPTIEEELLDLLKDFHAASRHDWVEKSDVSSDLK